MPKVLNPHEIAAFRDRLCDVAERLFAEHGPDAVTVRQLASELGVSAMTPYRYFADKDAMLAAVRTRAFDRFAQALEAAHTSATGDAGEAYLDFALGNRAAYTLMFDVDQPTSTDYPDLVSAMERARATMAYGVEPGVSREAAALFAHMVWSALHGAVMLELTDLLATGMDARTIARETLRALRQAAT